MNSLKSKLLFFSFILVGLPYFPYCFAEEQNRRKEDEALFRSHITEGTFVGVDLGKSIIWNGNQNTRLSIDWMPGRVGFHLGYNQFHGTWGSLFTEKSPEEFSDPTEDMNPDAEVFRSHSYEDPFKMNLIEVAWSFTSTMIRRSQNYLMQLDLGYVGGQAVDPSISRNFLIRGLYAEGAMMSAFGADRRNWLRLSISYTGAQLLGPPKDTLTEAERSLYVQFAQIHLGYFYQLF